MMKGLLKLPSAIIKPMPTLSGRTVPMPLTQAPHTIGQRHMQWAAVIRHRANYTCERCGRHDVRMYADHIVEVMDGGTFDLDNGQCLCGSCHVKKTNEQRRSRLRLDAPPM